MVAPMRRGPKKYYGDCRKCKRVVRAMRDSLGSWRCFACGGEMDNVQSPPNGDPPCRDQKK